MKKKHHKKKQKKKNEEKLMDEGLEAIYGSEKMDFSTFERGKGRFTRILTTSIIILAIIAIISWITFILYTKYKAPQEETFQISIEAPEQVKSGEEVLLKIRYSNPSNTPITALELDANIPQTFQVSSLSPEPDNKENLIWNIGTLGSNADGILLIEGTWLAKNPSSTPIQVHGNYRPGNFNADFQDIETVYIETIGSNLEIEFEGIEEIIPGEVSTYSIRGKNTGEISMNDIEINLDLPNGFFIEESEPSLEAGASPVWQIPTLEPGEETEIIFTGSFASDISGFQYFDLTGFININDQSLEQTSTQGFTDVLSSDLNLQLIIDGSTESVQTTIGSPLNITISYQNTGESEIESDDIILDFQSDFPIPIDWNQASLEGGVIKKEGIIFDSSLIGSLAPQEKTIFNLSFPLSSTIGVGQADSFTVSANTDHNNINVKSSPIEITISSNPTLSSEARYYTESGAPLGEGPIPPEVGEKTTYRIFWKVENPIHELENVTITANLAPNAIWEEQFSTDLGSINYDTSSNTIQWKIDLIPDSISELSANFAISINPEKSSIGSFVKLLSGATLKATDSVTQVQLEDSTESLDTDLINDSFAEEGIIQE